MSSQLIADLKEIIANSPVKPLIVCGAGVSIASTGGGAPSWKMLLESGIEKVTEIYSGQAPWAAYAIDRLNRNSTPEWVSVADEVTDRLGGSTNGEFSGWLEKCVRHLETTDETLIKAIAALGCPIATTNYDDVLATGLSLRPVTWDDKSQVHRFLNGSLDGVLHLHGHWAKPETIVLGSKSYGILAADAKASLLSEFTALQRSLVYIGCSADGLSDPDFTNLNSFVSEWQQTAPRSYWLVKKGSVENQFVGPVADNKRLFAVEYGESNNELPAFLKSISPIVLPEINRSSDVISIEQQEPKPDLFGRDEHLSEIEAGLLSGRSVVIGGGPGLGKTALAVGALYRQAVVEQFARRRFFVSVEADREARAFLTGLAGVLGIVATGDEVSLLRQLQVAADTPTVAILDNAEHIFESDRSGAERVLRLLAQIENLSVVVTTRGAVPAIAGAVSIPDLAKLPSDAAKNAFVNRAGQLYRDDADLDSLLDALDGHALSIDLVAAQVVDGASLSYIQGAWQEMRAAVLKKYGVVESRLTSVRASLALSLQSDLFKKMPIGRRLMAILSMLPAGLPHQLVAKVLAGRGGMTKVKAAEAVLVLQQLRLVERRLDGRLRMLTPLREAARMDLTVLPVDKKRLFEIYLDYISNGTDVGTLHWQESKDTFESEFGNFPAILNYAVDSKFELNALRAAAIGYGDYCRFTGQGSLEPISYVLHYFNKIGNVGLTAQIHGMIALIMYSRGEYTGAKRHYLDGIRFANQADLFVTKGNCLSGLGRIADDECEMDAAEDFYTKALESFKSANDVLGQANVISHLASLNESRGVGNVVAMAEEALTLFRKVGDDLGIVNASSFITDIQGTSSPDQCRKLAEKYSTLGSVKSEWSAYNRYAFLAQAEGLYSEANEVIENVIKNVRASGFIDLEVVATIIKGIIARRTGNGDWKNIISSGFQLISQVTWIPEVELIGYKELESYLVSEDDVSKAAALERTKAAWERSNSRHLIRQWLTVDVG